MKVLFLSNIPTPNQLDFVIEVNKYVAMKYVLLYPTEKGRDWSLSKIPNMIILNFKKNIQNYYTYYKLYKEFDPDVVLVGGYTLPLGMFSYLLCKKDKKKFMYWLEKPNKSIRVKKALKHWFMKWKSFVIRPDVVLGIGRETANFYKKYFRKVKNFPYSMDLSKYYDAYRTKDSDTINFLFCGQLIDRKNIVNVVQAFSKLKNYDIKLNILGSGELLPIIEKYIGEDKRIKLLGFIQPENLYKIYQDNDVFVLPSLDDGWALVINEAMAAGMPIIGTDEVGAIEEFIEHKQNGFICGVDVDSIKEGMFYYIENKELINEHGIKNKKIIQNSLADVTNSAPKFKEIIESLYQ